MLTSKAVALVRIVVLVSLVLMVALSVAQSVTYNVVPITSPFDPPGTVFVNDINRWGMVAAVDRKSGRLPMAFTWRAGKATPLPTFGGTCGSANGISDPGHVVGSACLPGDSAFHAFLYRNKHLIDIHAFGDANSFGSLVNRNDQVVGGFVLSGIQHSFFWEKKSAVDLGFLGGSNTFAFGLNEAGVVVGQSDISGDPDPIFGIPPFHAFEWSAGAITDLGTIFGGNFSYASAINDSGQIVGSADLAGDLAGHAYLLENGVATDLSPYGESVSAWGNDINGQGDIVGSLGSSDTDPADGPPCEVIVCPCFAVVWRNGTLTFLNSVIDPQWDLLLGLRINNRGQIVARGRFNGGPLQTVLLKPINRQQGSVSTSYESKRRKGVPSPTRGFRRQADGKITVLQ